MPSIIRHWRWQFLRLRSPARPIKTKTAPKIGKPGEPVAELTQLEWTIISPGREPADLTKMLITQTTASNYEDLCRLDVLGLQDHPTGDQDNVYKEFKEQLVRSPDGRYEMGLLWKGNHPTISKQQVWEPEKVRQPREET